MNIQTGEIYGKQRANKFVLYSVLKVKSNKQLAQNIVTLQNIDNPKSLFEATEQKLSSSGYIRVSQTPYINTDKAKKRKQSPNRCPFTLDFLETRADNERPQAPLTMDLFS